MTYTVESARFQWEDGERRFRDAPDPARLQHALSAVIDELRRRLGSAFGIEELASFYGEGVDWATDLARERGAGGASAWVVDAAFAVYAREASDFAGGRRRERFSRSL